jgi:hypothetical protein
VPPLVEELAANLKQVRAFELADVVAIVIVMTVPRSLAGILCILIQRIQVIFASEGRCPTG